MSIRKEQPKLIMVHRQKAYCEALTKDEAIAFYMEKSLRFNVKF